ncbi:hypothetical protein LguiB_008811 [Lonicera macranthoides]
MNQNLIWVLLISFFLLIHTSRSDETEVKRTLITFLEQLSNGNGLPDSSLGWNWTSDPCKDQWKGLVCDNRTLTVKRILLDGFNFSGTFNANTLCSDQSLTASLSVISLNGNNLRGEELEMIANCTQLTRFYISGNQFSGSLPISLSRLNNLKVLDISHNTFSGRLPDLARISGLAEFFAQNNELSGPIPNFEFSNLVGFNVSFNNFSGFVPTGGDKFPVSSYINNPQLCGDPLPQKCSSLPSESPPVTKGKNKSGFSRDQILMFSGYILIGVAVVLVILLCVCKKKKKKEETLEEAGNHKVAAVEFSSSKPSIVSNDYKTGASKSGVSVENSIESGIVSSALVVLTSPEVNGLKFEELLKAPAELIGKGKYSSVYKVICKDQGNVFAVKRIKDWAISSNEFKLRMQRLDQVKHPNVLPTVAFYCSKQEKLLVYEYQANGSLFRLLHGTPTGQVFDWSSRLGLASTIAEALAFMHEELHEDGISHGNLKSSNILLNKNMEPCISEYGQTAGEYRDLSLVSTSFQLAIEDQQSAFKADVYGFGIILLELLTGKISVVQNNGMDLAKWVVSVVREEWTVEVFDKRLIREGASEGRMVNLLQVAIKCVNCSLEARPSMGQIAVMINNIKEEEERSMDVSESISLI